jgi:protein-S-isoprenylcysteine O-methyltransferase Ste14
VPEPHVVVLAAALLAQWSRPWPLRVRGGPAAGWSLILAGGLLAAWATAAAGDVDLSRPDRLVTGGPYRLCRHPMYLGWTVAYVGIGLARGTVWPFALSPALALLLGRTVRREERVLARTFGPPAGRRRPGPRPPRRGVAAGTQSARR